MSNECPICNDPFSEVHKPKVAPCGHSICSVCVNQLQARNQPYCPFCKASVNWQTVPDNFALLNVPTGDEALRQLARTHAEQKFAELSREESELITSIEQLRVHEERIKRERAEMMARPRTPFDLERVLGPLRVMVERSIEEIQVMQEEVKITDIDGQKLIQIKQMMFNLRVIHERIVVIAENNLKVQDAELPEDDRDDPVAITVRMLQKDSNNRMRVKQWYLKALSEIDSIRKQMIEEKKRAIELCETHRKTLTEQSQKTNKDISHCRLQCEEASKAILRLREEMDELKTDSRKMALQYEEVLLSLKREAEGKLLELLEMTHAIQVSSQPAIDANRTKLAETFATLRGYLQFLRDLLTVSDEEKTEAAKRIEKLRKMIAENPQLPVIEKDHQSMIERHKQLNQSVKEASDELEKATKVKQAKQKKVIDAQKQATDTEARLKKSVEENKQTEKRTDAIRKELIRLQGDIKLMEVKIDEINTKYATIVEKQTAVDKEVQSYSEIVRSAIRYETEILTPILLKIVADMSVVTAKLDETEATYKEDISALETEYHRLTIHNVSVTPFVSSPIFTPQSPMRGLNSERRQLTALEGEKNRLVKECALLERRLTDQSSEAKQKQFEFFTERAGGPADMMWAFVVSLAGAFLFFSLIGR